MNFWLMGCFTRKRLARFATVAEKQYQELSKVFNYDEKDESWTIDNEYTFKEFKNQALSGDFNHDEAKCTHK